MSNKDTLKELRASVKMTQPEFAKLTGFSLDTIKSWETERNQLKDRDLRFIKLVVKDYQENKDK